MESLDKKDSTKENLDHIIKIWEKASGSLTINEYLSPVYAMFRCVKKTICYMVKTGMLKKRMTYKIDKEKEKNILGNFFKTFFEESQFDLTDRLNKHMRASFAKMFKIFKFPQKDQKPFMDYMGKELKDEFKNYGSGSKIFSSDLFFNSGDEKKTKKLIDSTFEILLDFDRFEQFKVILLFDRRI